MKEIVSLLVLIILSSGRCSTEEGEYGEGHDSLTHSDMAALDELYQEVHDGQEKLSEWQFLHHEAAGRDDSPSEELLHVFQDLPTVLYPPTIGDYVDWVHTPVLDISSKRNLATSSSWQDVSVANFLRTRKVHTVHIPLHVNLFFVGFEGDGNRLLEFEEGEFESWFAHMEHEVEHIWAPLDEHGAFGTGDVPHSHFMFDIKLRAQKLSPAFSTSLEDVLRWNLLNDDMEGEKKEKTYYMNAFSLETMLAELVDYLELEKENSIFILNPKRVTGTSLYGYRVGFSSQETGFLMKKRDELLEFADKVDPFRSQVNGEQDGDTQKPICRRGYCYVLQDSGRGMTKSVDQDEGRSDSFGMREHKLHWMDLRTAADEWATTHVLNSNIRQGTYRAGGSHLFHRNSARGIRGTQAEYMFRGEVNVSGTLEYAKRILQGEPGPLRDVLLHELHRGEKSVSNWSEDGSAIDCLVDNWIAYSRRFMWMDLTAGPFQWGPELLGSMGLRSASSKPRAPLPHHIVDHGRATLKVKEKQLDGLMRDWQEQCHDAVTTEDPGARQYCRGLESHVSLMQEQVRTIREARAVKALAGEPLEEADQDGGGDTDDEASSRPGKRKWRRRETLQSTSRSTQYRKGPEDERDMRVVEEHAEGDSPDSAFEVFLGSLSAYISTAIRFVLTPPTPTLMDRPFSRVHFDVYLITDHPETQTRGYAGFHYERFKSEVSRLAMPDQAFDFTLRHVELSESPAIALAIVSSIREATFPYRRKGNQTTIQQQAYIDSRALYDRLKPTLEPYSEGETVTHTRRIPVFILSLRMDGVPLLVDKYYQSRVVGGAILVVQTGQRGYTSFLQCNGRELLVDLQNPLKSALGSAGLAIGGLLPKHVSYHAGTKQYLQNWMWSVGTSPLARTSDEMSFSKLELDTARRNAFFASMNHSISLLNNGVDVLHTIRVRDCVGSGMKRTLMTIGNAFKLVLRHWSLALHASDISEWDAAVAAAEAAVPRAELFLESVDILHREITLAKCQEELDNLEEEDSPLETVLMHWSTPLFFAADAVLLFLIGWNLRSQKGKVKIN